MFRISKRKLIVVIVAAFFAGGAAGVTLYDSISTSNFTLPGLAAKPAGGASEEIGAAISTDGLAREEELAAYLKDNYYRPVSAGAIDTGLLRGIFMSPGDPYTMYYTKEEYEQAMERTHGELSGVGMTLTANDDGFIEVMGVVDGSPASEAGIRPGDLLLSVDGTNYSGEQLSEAVEAAHGEVGTEVVIGISRDGMARDYAIVRAVFVTPTVAREFMKNGAGDEVGYIRVTSFNDNTSADFEAALKVMDEEGVKGVVIDVRNNAGGLVDKAVEMDDMLLDKGVICYAEDGKGERIEYATEDGKVTDIPYAVLIDETSVSAAEIFALGVKAGGGGKLVGRTTYGKGLIQKLEKFEAGDGARITIMQYVTPDGEPVNGVGIAPDLTVDQPEEARQGSKTDAQLQRALSLF
jgi:carboxyl-terminal processing protease